jgi:ribosomal protein L14
LIAVIVRTKKKTIKRSDGMAVRFDDNAAMLLSTPK